MVSFKAICENNYSIILDSMIRKNIFENYNNYEDTEACFKHMLNGYYHDFFQVEDGNNNYLGVIFSYDFRLNDLNCKMEFVFNDNLEEDISLDIINLHVQYLFKEYPINKIYIKCENRDKVTLLQRAQFEIEMTLKDYLYLDGKYVDQIFLSRRR